MKGTDLFYGMNYVDDSYIFEAVTWKRVRKRNNTIFLLCSVAAAVIIACALIMAAFFRNAFESDRPLEDFPTMSGTELQTDGMEVSGIDSAYRYEVELGKDVFADGWSWMKEQGYIETWDWLAEQGYIDTREKVENYYLSLGYDKLEEFHYDLYDYPGTTYWFDLTSSSIRIAQGRKYMAYNDIIHYYNRKTNYKTYRKIDFAYQDIFLKNVFQNEELPGCSPEEAREYCDPLADRFGMDYEYVDVYVLDYGTIAQITGIEELQKELEEAGSLGVLAPDFNDLEGKKGTWTPEDAAYLLVYRGQRFEGLPLIYDSLWMETSAIYSPEKGLIYFNINRDPEAVEKKEKVYLIPIEEATELFYQQAEDQYELQRDTIEITGYELVYAWDLQEQDFKDYISPYWKISFQPKTSIKDWMPFSEKYGLLKEEYRGSDAYLLVEASGGEYMEEEEPKYYVYETEKKKIDETEFRSWLEDNGYILPEETIREMGYQIGNDLEGDEQTQYRGVIATFSEDFVLLWKNDMHAAYATGWWLSEEVVRFKYQDFYLRKLFPDSEIEGYPVEQAEDVFLPILEKMGLAYESRDVYAMNLNVMKKLAEIQQKMGKNPVLPEYDPEMTRGGRAWQEDDIAYLFVYRNRELDGNQLWDNYNAIEEYQAMVVYSPKHGLISLEASIPSAVKKKTEVPIISKEMALQRAKETDSLKVLNEDTYTISDVELVYARDQSAFKYDENWNVISRTDTCSPYWKFVIEPVNGIEEWFPTEAELFSESTKTDGSKAYILVPAVEGNEQ